MGVLEGTIVDLDVVVLVVVLGKNFLSHFENRESG
jgi:hypothetical protein